MISNTGEAYKAIDTDQNTCAVTSIFTEDQTKTWWKVWLKKQFNIGYLEIHFKTDGKERDKER